MRFFNRTKRLKKKKCNLKCELTEYCIKKELSFAAIMYFILRMGTFS